MALTPMMQQYVNTKEEHPDCILFYRLGDFYEMFFDDALTVARELDLTLTGKACGLPERAPMCGVPHHSAQSYITRLVNKGFKVAVCEQVEDPKEAKGIVRREVVRIVTPGTNNDLDASDSDSNRYLAAVVATGSGYGLAFADMTTGTFLVTDVRDAKEMLDEVNRFAPVEILMNQRMLIDTVGIETYCKQTEIAYTALGPEYFNESACEERIKRQFKVSFLDGLGLTTVGAVLAAGAVLRYLFETQKAALRNILDVRCYQIGGNMVIDGFTRRNLELTETMRDARKTGTLFWVLDKTKTAMGARFMRNAILSPLMSKEAIEARYDAVTAMNEDVISRDELREYLSGIYDMERLIGKIAYGSLNPRDLLALCQSIAFLPAIRTVTEAFDAPYIRTLHEGLDCLEDLRTLIEAGIDEDAPLTVRDGGIIKPGYDTEVDELRDAAVHGKDWIVEIEQRERARTGIKNLRVKYNKNFGYCLEVTKSMLEKVPDDYIRRQTLTNAERYTIEELKTVETKILGAEEHLYQRELTLFHEIRETVAGEIARILTSAHIVAVLDFLQSLAYVAAQNGYIRPEITDTGGLDIKNGRHPVVERMIERDGFIANDVHLDLADERIGIITGPNMSGKSTYMRQVALIILMAQMGSFVPAEICRYSLTDRIFTRVGASDNLASGQSTFMVEMTEVANILRHATENSLLILDEIGRGTSTFDGLSLAWAIVEYIANPACIGAKTLFATHYHELTELEGKVPHVINYFIDVHESNDNVVFLRKILRGGADKSYGIQVAKLAGVPAPVIERAKELAAELDRADVTKKISDMAGEQGQGPMARQMTILDFEETVPADEPSNGGQLPVAVQEVVAEIMETELNDLSPRAAWDLLDRIREKLKNV